MATGSEAVEALVRVSSDVQRALALRAGARGISSVQTRMLEFLQDRAPTMHELAGLLGSDKSSTSGLVDRAERRGLVRRVPSQLDRRSVRVRLTPSGRELLRAVSELFNGDVAAMLAPLATADREALAAYLQLVCGGPSAAGGDGLDG